MRIAFVNPHGNFDEAASHLTAHPDFGGQLVYVREVALALAAIGHQVDILTRRIDDPQWPEFAAAIDGYLDQPGVRILRFPCGPRGFLPKEELWPHLGEWVGRILAWRRDEGEWPDLWTGHYADGGVCAALLAEQSGVPCSFTGHSLGAWKLDGLLFPSDSEASTYSRDDLLAADLCYNFGARIAAERAAMARAATIITNSFTERYDQYSHPAYAGVADVHDDRQFETIGPGVNLHVFDPSTRGPRDAEVRGAIHTALARDIAPERRDLPAVIAWSRLDPKKNHIALVRAFAQNPSLRARANLMMVMRGLDDPLRDFERASVGDQAVLRPLVREVQTSGLWGAVSAFSLAGQDALAALYRWGAETGAVFCLPSEHEPFSLTVIEAMSTGLPVVATRNGGPREITDDGRAGLLADPNNYAELGSQLLRLLADRDAWQAYASAGRQRVLDRYSWARTAEGYARLAGEIARGERAGRKSYPLPDFLRDSPEVTLPRLSGWQGASPGAKDVAPGDNGRVVGAVAGGESTDAAFEIGPAFIRAE